MCNLKGCHNNSFNFFFSVVCCMILNPVIILYLDYKSWAAMDMLKIAAVFKKSFILFLNYECL